MEKIKILPVYPKFPETFWSHSGTMKFTKTKALIPPLGLATVCAMLPKEFDVKRIIDLNVEDIQERDILEADYVFMSSMHVQSSSHNNVMELARSLETPVVVGGPYATSYPELNQKAEHIITSEAEITLPPFLEDLVNGVAKRFYSPESVQGRIKISLESNGKPVLTQTPIPRWDLIDLANYTMAATQYSRGCPFNCDFCDITNLFGTIPRTKSFSQMLEELDAIYDTGFRGGIFNVDDNLVGNKKNLREFLQRLIIWQEQKDYPFSFVTEASVDLAWDSNKDILEAMVRAGYKEVFIGIESPDPEILKSMNKRQNIKMNPVDAVRKIQNTGLIVTAGFISGFDGEKPEVFEELYEFIHRAGIPISMTGLLVALKNTRLYDRLEQEGRLRDQAEGSNTHNFSLNFEPQLADGFSEQDLINGYKDFLRRIYDDKDYYSRCNTLQRNLGHTPHLTKTAKTERKIFYRFLKDQLLGRNITWETVKYLTKTAVRNPKYFAQAVTDTVRLLHFKGITDAAIEAEDYIPRVISLYDGFLQEAGEICLRYQGNLRKTRTSIKRKAEKLIERAEKSYHLLHEDFRQNAYQVLEDLRDNIRIKLKGFDVA